VALQLGRSFAALIDLVATHSDRRVRKRAASTITLAVLRGARDRSAENPPRTLRDQQRRDDSLTHVRSRRRQPSFRAKSCHGDKVAA
jgi:hypothetical protein